MNERHGPLARRGRTAAWSWLAVTAAACATVPAGRAGRLDELAAALAELQARPELAGGRVGVCVVDAQTGESLLAADADRGFATASNMKLITAAVALTALGPEHRTTTTVWARGEITDGTLQGDLILRGHGDPAFGKGEAGRRHWAEVIDGVRAAGIRRVTGAIVGDDAWLGREHLGLGWQWDYLDEDYAAPFGGLCCNGNVVAVTVQPQAGGAAPLVRIEPPVFAVDVRVRDTSPGAAQGATVSRALGREQIVVRGTLASDARPSTTVVAVPEPALFAARVFAAKLREAGIEVGDDAATSDASSEATQSPQPPGPFRDRSIVVVPSPPVHELLGPTLGASDNLYAEQLARIAARVATGDGSTAALQRHALGVLKQLGVDTAGMVLADGSGLSRRNLVRPRQLAQLLVAMHRSPHREPFVAALPLAGKTGTLRNRFAAGPAHGRVRAKTGFISRVVCLSGYVPRLDPTAAPLVFSVMLNDFTCDDTAAKAAVDAFVQRLVRVADR